MKNLVILFISILFINPIKAQRWSSSFIGKPESRALYASNVAKAIQNAWETELSSKGKKEMLLDEIIFGQDSDPKETNTAEIFKPIMNNIDEIEEVLGIKEEILKYPVNNKIEIPKIVAPISESASLNAKENIDKIGKSIEDDNSKLSKIDDYSSKKYLLSITNDDIEVDSVYAIPQVSPVFPGGYNALKKFFAQNITMPESKGQLIKGKVFVRFMVRKSGELSKIYLVKGLNDDCNKEALRVVRKMPFWIPAKQEEKAVNSWYTLPIHFEIE